MLRFLPEIINRPFHSCHLATSFTTSDIAEIFAMSCACVASEQLSQHAFVCLLALAGRCGSDAQNRRTRVSLTPDHWHPRRELPGAGPPARPVTRPQLAAAARRKPFAGELVSRPVGRACGSSGRYHSNRGIQFHNGFEGSDISSDMPTVILLDVSLSMCKSIKGLSSGSDENPNENATEIRQLANIGIGILLDYFAQNAQLEHTALIVFSSLWEIRHQFTRHHESIKNGIYDLELYDKSNIVNAVRGALTLKLEDWAQNGLLNIILITDGQVHNPRVTLNTEDKCTPSSRDEFHDIPLADLEGQFDFPCKMQVICLTSPRDPSLKNSLPFYKRLISIVDSTSADCPVISCYNSRSLKQSAIWLPESNTLDITIESVERLFAHMSDFHYKPHHTVLSCGHLSSMVLLSPKPSECLHEPLKNEFDDLKNEESLNDEVKETYVSAINKVRLFKLADEINICGFMPLVEIASPSVVSRHLVLPVFNNKFNETSKAEQILSQNPNAYNKSLQTVGALYSATEEPCSASSMVNSSRAAIQEGANKPGKHSTSSNETSHDQDITKQPSFCVLLHNCLKQENMVAICIVGKSEESNDDWFGMLHSHVDSRKRSSLMLSLFIPGPNPVLWLPNFRSLGSACLNAELPPAIRDKVPSNRSSLKSYSSNNVIWLDPESVQADVQKIVRHAKRAPEKAPHFYKELNRIRRAAISYGFYDVLFGLAAILEREKRVLMLDQSKNVNQEILNHIDHVIASLRANLSDDSYETNIAPISSNPD